MTTTDNFIPIYWSASEDYPTPGTESRLDFYGVTDCPSAVFGGTEEIFPTEQNPSAAANYGTLFVKYIEVASCTSPIELSMGFDKVDDSYNVAADVRVTDDVLTPNNKIFFVVTCDTVFVKLEEEGSLPYDCYWSYRALAVSEPVEFIQTADGEVGTYGYSFDSIEFPDCLDINETDYYAIAIIQSWDTKEILQAQRVRFGTAQVDTEEDVILVGNSLSNYPNPFNPETTINYSIAEAGDVSLKIYNIKGQLVKTLVNECKDAGTHAVTWSADDISSGVYFYKLKSGNFTSIKKMILMK